MMTAARITHPGTGEQTALPVAEVQTFAEVKEFNENNGKVISEVKEKLTTAIAALLFLPAKSGFEFSKDGTMVRDAKTGLIWSQNANLAGRKMNWSEATSWVSGINVGGFKDWRLPTKEELQTMAKAGGRRPADWFNSIGFNSAQADGYWSSTTYAGLFWLVHMYDGYVIYIDKSNYCYVWPVRSGQ